MGAVRKGGWGVVWNTSEGRAGFLWLEASGVRSSCEVCPEREARVVFWLSPVSDGWRKQLEKLSLVLEKLVFAGKELIGFQEGVPLGQRRSGVFQEQLPLPYVPLSPRAPHHSTPTPLRSLFLISHSLGPIWCLGRKAVYLCICPGVAVC